MAALGDASAARCRPPPRKPIVKPRGALAIAALCLAVALVGGYLASEAGACGLPAGSFFPSTSGFKNETSSMISPARSSTRIPVSCTNRSFAIVPSSSSNQSCHLSRAGAPAKLVAY